MATYLNASMTNVASLDDCIDPKEVWRGALVIREKKVRTCVCRGKKCCASAPFLKKKLKNDTVAGQNRDFKSQLYPEFISCG